METRSEKQISSVTAKNILAAAAESGLSLSALAEEAGVSRAHLYAFLNGEQDATLGWLTKIANALETEPSDLVRAAKPKHSPNE